MLISQFMGRLARVSRVPKSTTITHHRRGQTDRRTDTGHGRYQFNSILLYSDVRFRKCLISAHSRPVVYFSLLVESCTGNDSLLIHFKPLQYDNHGRDIRQSYVEVSKVDQEKVVRDFHEKVVLDMDNQSCSDALDDLHVFYKVGTLLFPAS
jgi:hypothetical protein